MATLPEVIADCEAITSQIPAQLQAITLAKVYTDHLIAALAQAGLQDRAESQKLGTASTRLARVISDLTILDMDLNDAVHSMKEVL